MHCCSTAFVDMCASKTHTHTHTGKRERKVQILEKERRKLAGDTLASVEEVKFGEVAQVIIATVTLVPMTQICGSGVDVDGSTG